MGTEWIPPLWDLRIVPHSVTVRQLDVPAIIDAVAPTLWGLVPMWVKIGSVLVIVVVIIFVILKKRQ
jgi:hypothetical protein